MAKLSAEETTGYQPMRAARGTVLSCKGWQQEAALRMLMNNLDPDVAEKPEDLIVYGGRGKAARNWNCFHAIVESLKSLENDETLAGAIRQAGGNFPHALVRAARADREFESRGTLERLEAFRRARSRGTDDVRPDDRRKLDLHRHRKEFCRARMKLSRRPAGNIFRPPISRESWSSAAAWAEWVARSRWPPR